MENEHRSCSEEYMIQWLLFKNTSLPVGEHKKNVGPIKISPTSFCALSSY
jgi:hypothetical protein